MREESCLEGRPPKPLVYVRPSDNLAKVVRTLFSHKCSMAPILSADPSDPSATVLHIATLSGVLNCLMRHFRASLASLPLLAQPLGQLPVGTWAPDHQFSRSTAPAAAGQQEDGLPNGGLSLGKGSSPAAAAAAREGAGDSPGSVDGGVVVGRTVAPLHAVTPNTPLTNALGMLLEAGVSITRLCWTAALYSIEAWAQLLLDHTIPTWPGEGVVCDLAGQCLACQHHLLRAVFVDHRITAFRCYAAT